MPHYSLDLQKAIAGLEEAFNEELNRLDIPVQTHNAFRLGFFAAVRVKYVEEADDTDEFDIQVMRVLDHEIARLKTKLGTTK